MSERFRDPTILGIDHKKPDLEEENFDDDIVERSYREIGVVMALDNFVENNEIDNKEKAKLAGMSERRQWGKVFTKLEKGDRVVSFISPGANFLAIKYLNDEIFGPTKTNEIIHKRRDVLRIKIAQINEGKEDEQKIELLQSDYKTEIYRIPKDSAINLEDIDTVMQDVDRQMKDFILTMVDGLINGKVVGGNLEKLKNFRTALNGELPENHGKGGFRVNYGIATVNGNSAEEKMLALGSSLQAGLLSRRTTGEGKYGSEFNQDQVLEDVKSINSLREEMIKDGNTLVDKSGNSWNIFLPTPKEGAKQTYILNRDLLRDVRKGKIKVDSSQQPLLDKIIVYIKKLNILDVIKPFVKEEIDEVEQRAIKSKILGDKMRNGSELEDSERASLAQELYSDERAKNFTSKMEFDRRAIGMKNAVYISMDVKDLGVDLLLEYETVLQNIAGIEGADKKFNSFKEASLSAGDETTRKLRAFWKSVQSVCGEFGLQGKDNLFTAHVGGDELTLAFEIGDGVGKIKSEQVQNLLLALKRATNSRVIETRISESEKHVMEGSDNRQKTEAHLRAIKKAEAGTDIIKNIEAIARKLTNSLKQGKQQEVSEKLSRLPAIFEVRDGEVLVDVVVMEKNDISTPGADFDLVNEGRKSFRYDDIKNLLDRFVLD